MKVIYTLILIIMSVSITGNEINSEPNKNSKQETDTKTNKYLKVKYKDYTMLLVTPIYPKAFIEKKITGQVAVEYDIVDNKIENIKILSSEYKEFSNACIKALKESRVKHNINPNEKINKKGLSRTYDFRLKK